MTYLKNIIFLFHLFFVFNIQGQIIISPNYVQNSSFEIYSSCPNSSDDIYKAIYWWGASTEYYNACSWPGTFSVPSNSNGFHYAHTGVAYSGCIIYDNITPNIDYRESIKTKLTDTLIKNKLYCTTFYTTLSQYSYTYYLSNYLLLDSIGMLFSKDSIKDSIGPIYSNGIKVQNSIINLDTINWFNISNIFIANGGEKYLTVGNFDNIINCPIGLRSSIYVYIDDVSVCECSFKFSLGNDTTLCNGETLQLNVSMPNAIYTWQDGSTDSTYKVTQAGTYWVRAYFADYNITTTDTINITYKDCEDTLIIPNIFTPNGDGVNDYFVVKNSNNWNINLQVFNRWGVKVYEDDNYKNNWDGKYKGNPLADGTYFYIIKAKGKDTGKEKEYNGSLMIMR